MTIICNQRKCRHLARDAQLKVSVCTVDMLALARVADGRSFILRCSNYCRRLDWTPNGTAPLRVINDECDSDGIYPGQIRTKPDINPDIKSGKTLVEVFTEEGCDT
jgi:hypothetical protein